MQQKIIDQTYKFDQIIKTISVVYPNIFKTHITCFISLVGPYIWFRLYNLHSNKWALKWIKKSPWSKIKLASPTLFL